MQFIQLSSLLVINHLLFPHSFKKFIDCLLLHLTLNRFILQLRIENFILSKFDVIIQHLKDLCHLFFDFYHHILNVFRNVFTKNDWIEDSTDSFLCQTMSGDYIQVFWKLHSELEIWNLNLGWMANLSAFYDSLGCFQSWD